MPVAGRVLSKNELITQADNIYKSIAKYSITPAMTGQLYADIVETLYSITSASTVIRTESAPPPSPIPGSHEEKDIWIDLTSGSSNLGNIYQLESGDYQLKGNIKGQNGLTAQVWYADDSNNNFDPNTSGITSSPFGKKFRCEYFPSIAGAAFDTAKAQGKWVPFGRVSRSGVQNITANNLTVDMELDYAPNALNWSGVLTGVELKNLRLGAKATLRLKSNNTTWSTVASNIGYDANTPYFISAAFGTPGDIIRVTNNSSVLFLIESIFANSTRVNKNISTVAATGITVEKLVPDTVLGFLSYNSLVTGVNTTAKVNGTVNTPIRVEQRRYGFRSGVDYEVEIECIHYPTNASGVLDGVPTITVKYFPIIK